MDHSFGALDMSKSALASWGMYGWSVGKLRASRNASAVIIVNAKFCIWLFVMRQMSKVVASSNSSSKRWVGEEFSFGKKKNQDGTYQDTRYSVPAFRNLLSASNSFRSNATLTLDAHKKNVLQVYLVGTLGAVDLSPLSSVLSSTDIYHLRIGKLLLSSSSSSRELRVIQLIFVAIRRSCTTFGQS